MENNIEWQGTLTISIDSAAGLVNEDTFGLSDPFCHMKVESEEMLLFEGRTPVVDDNLNPKWAIRFTRQVKGKGHLSITFDVFDDDVGDPDFLGHFVYRFIPKPEIEESHTVSLTDQKGGTKTNRGTLTFTVWYSDEKVLPLYVSTEVYEKPGAKSTVVLGPWLLFRKSSDTDFTYSVDILALTDTDAAPDFTLRPRPLNDVIVDKILEFEGKYLWRFKVTIPRHNDRLHVHYSVSKSLYQFIVPAIKEPLRSIVVSCNGFHEDPPKEFKKEKFHLWKVANTRAEEIGGYHLIIQGGDQVYADPIWKLDELKDIEPGHPEGAKRKVSPEFRTKIEQFYMKLYIDSWGHETDLSKAYATVPSVMMWDDHDVFDGWGSYSPELMKSELYQALGKMAEKYFCAFQLGATVEEVRSKVLPSSMLGASPGYSQMYRIDTTGIACLDLRTERTMKTVCSQQTYDDFTKWMRDNSEKMNHLFLVLSIPIVYNDFDVLEKAIAATGLGEELKDDLQDHWRTEDHRKERLDLLKLLLSEADKGKFRITILSGDVHISCAGVVYDTKAAKKSNAAIINSLISSAVVNLPPPPAVIQILELTGSEIEIVERTPTTVIKAGLYRLLGDPRQYRYFGGRNYLELAQNSVGGFHARWFVEGHEHESFQLYIYPFKENLKVGKREKFLDKIFKENRLRTDDFKFVSNSLTSLISLPAQTISSWFQ